MDCTRDDWQASAFDHAGRHSVVRMTFATGLVLLLFAGTTNAQNSGPQRFPGQPVPQLAPPPREVLPTAPRPTAGLPRNIAAMPGISAELQVIHHRSQLLIGQSNVFRWAVADPGVVEIAQFSPNEISILGMSEGATTVTFWFEGDPTPVIYLVRVIRDPSLDEQRRIDYGKLEQKLAYLFPNSKVYLVPLSRKLIVRGQAADAEEAAQILQIIRGEVVDQDGGLIGPQIQDLDPTNPNYTANDLQSSFIVNMLEVPGEKQVMLHVRIAELNRAELRRMGVDLNVLLRGGRHSVTTVAGGFPSTITGIFENGEVAVLVNWLASNGMVKFLSAPTLTVMSGHPASFLAGGEFAVPTIVGVEGVGAQQTTFRGFGTSLVVVPTVTDHDLVRMRIVPEFSQVNFDNAVGGVPGVDSRRVHTTVQLREGQTIALAGLYAQQTDTEITRIPWLGDLPYIGPRIFSAKRASQDQTELLILVTPEIVRPMDPECVPPLPGFNVTPPEHDHLYKYAMGEGPPDLNRYHLAPLGHGTGIGESIGPYSPCPPGPDGAGCVTPTVYSVSPPGEGQPYLPKVRPNAKPRGSGAATPPATPATPIPRRGETLAPMPRESAPQGSGMRSNDEPPPSTTRWEWPVRPNSNRKPRPSSAQPADYRFPTTTSQNEPPKKKSILSRLNPWGSKTQR